MWLSVHVVLIEIIFERSGVSEDLRIPYLLKSQVPNFPNSRQLELSSLSDIWICISASLSFGQTPHYNANRCRGGGKHSQRSFTDRFVTYMIELIIWKLVWKVYNNQNQLCEISQFSFSDKNINKPSAEANVAIVRPTPPAIKAELGQQQWFIALQLASEQHIILHYNTLH